MRMSSRIESIGTAIVVVAAVVVAAANVYRVFGPPEVSSMPEEEPEFLGDSIWRQAISVGHLTGDVHAPIRVIEFADLECPFCKRSHSSLMEARDRYGDSLAYVFVHFPLEMHRFARPAARAAECAAQQHVFASFVNAVFAQQDSLGLKPWTSYGTDAGVADTTTFTRCIAKGADQALLNRGPQLGKRVGVAVTPTVIVNGWRLGGSAYTDLLGVIAEVLDSKSPYHVR